MCLLIVKSTNPKFSFLIKKNPSTGMIIKSIRKGHAFGYYDKNDPTRYVIYFKDNDNEISYKEYPNQEFEYINHLRYTSPIFVLNTVHEFLNACRTKQDAEDTNGFSHSIFVNMVNIQPQTLSIIKKIEPYFKDFNISMIKKISGNYQITISTELSFYHLLNFVVVYFGIISILNENDLETTDSFIEKILGSVNILNTPYYIRYIFASRILATPKNFKKFKKMLETPGIKMYFGNTAMQRREYIESILEFKNQIIDIGCGEGSYAIPFSQRLKSILYHAVDIDPECLAKVSRKIIENGIQNILTYDSYTKLQLDNREKYDVIISEVVEHMEEEKSQDIIRYVLENINFNKIVITTPNFEFNKHYHIENFRHDDHKWEYTTEQFKKYINSTINIHSVNANFVGIGDTVDGISTTQAVILTKN